MISSFRILNKVVFSNVNNLQKFDIIDHTVNKNLKIDFSILLPLSLQEDNKDFLISGLPEIDDNYNDSATQTWGTPHNAWKNPQKVFILRKDVITLTFSTSYWPPDVWLMALLNKTQLAFEHHWLNVDHALATTGYYTPQTQKEPASWKEAVALPTIHQHLTELLGQRT